jgi:CheY-like chemotaxis protein
VRLYSVETLEQFGYRVDAAQDAAGALAILREVPDIDLLFTDVGLPGRNGRELATEALRLRPTLKVLYTTGYARNAIVHHGRLDAGVQLITKPFTRAELANKIRLVFGQVEAEAQG